MGGEELKWHQLAYLELFSQGPHFSLHSTVCSRRVQAELDSDRWSEQPCLARAWVVRPGWLENRSQQTGVTPIE